MAQSRSTSWRRPAMESKKGPTISWTASRPWIGSALPNRKTTSSARHLAHPTTSSWSAGPNMARPSSLFVMRVLLGGNRTDGPSMANVGADVLGEHVLALELARLTGEGDLTAVEQIDVVRGRERTGDVLLDQQQADPLPAEQAEEVEDLVDHLRGQAHADLVQQHHLGVLYVRAGQREHLLLAAAHRARDLTHPLAEAGKGADSSIQRHGLLATWCLQQQVLPDGQRSEHPASLRDVAHAAADK